MVSASGSGEDVQLMCFDLNSYLPEMIQKKFEVMALFHGSAFQEIAQKHFPKNRKYHVKFYEGIKPHVSGSYLLKGNEILVFLNTIVESIAATNNQEYDKVFLEIRTRLVSTIIHEASHAHDHARYGDWFDYDQRILYWLGEVLIPASYFTMIVCGLGAAIEKLREQEFVFLSLILLACCGLGVWSLFRLKKINQAAETTLGKLIAYQYCYTERRARKKSLQLKNTPEWQELVDIILIPANKPDEIYRVKPLHEI
ncbi:MAG TPA: hypothetical protein PKD79_02315 [Candidatus Doudnabacteria bacterium]|nr:hypothetical protein [Candidatus Doudnabacteria bacterium]